MSIPVTSWMWLAAVLPVVVLLVLMVKFQLGAAKAAPIGLGVALVVGLALYKAGPLLLATEAMKGVWSALSVLTVVWPAILIYEVTGQAKAFQVFRAGMQKVSPNELLQVLILGWVFTSFLQGITGFGVPVAVGAPLLLGIGVSPLWAVIIPPIGHSWGNTYGTLGMAWDAMAMLTDLAADPALYARTALWATALIWLWNATSGIAICLFYGGVPALKKGAPAVALLSLLMGGGQLLLAQFNATLACFLPCCLALVAALLLGRTKRYREPWRIENSRVMQRNVIEAEAVADATGGPPAGALKPKADEGPANMNLHQAFLPYYALTAVTLVVLLIPPLKELLGRWKVGFAFPQTATGYGFVNAATESYSPIAPLTHAGVFLLLAAGVGFWYFRRHGWLQKGDGAAVLKRSLKKTLPSGIAVVCFIVMSRIMSGTGQTKVLAAGIAAVLGRAYALLAPMVGVLGSFMTSSNMSSNILFSTFQKTTAGLLGLDVAAILGAQTAGGAIGSTISPGNIVLGTTTTGILGQEGKVLRKVLPMALAAAAVVGVILFIALVLL